MSERFPEATADCLAVFVDVWGQNISTGRVIIY